MFPSRLLRTSAALARPPTVYTGKVLDVHFVDFPVVSEPVNWVKEFPAKFKLDVYETPDWLDMYGFHNYENAKPTYKSRLEVFIKDLGLSRTEMAVLTEILGGHINKTNGKITLVSRRLPGVHANTNRCFQILLESITRAREITPEVVKSNAKSLSNVGREKYRREQKEAEMTATLTPYTVGDAAAVETAGAV